MKCEACGGDGLIEVGAYRGDESDTTTRECRLCGGVVSSMTGAMSVVTKFSQFGVSATQAAEGLQRLVHRSSESGRRMADLVIKTKSNAKSPADIAREYAARLNAENERRQHEAEQSTNEQMNHTIRSLR